MHKKITYIFIFFFSLGWLTSYAQSTIYTVKTVVIDAGHGGKDPGAVGKISKEKDITLSIALKLGKYIEENMPEVKIIYTRSTDVFVELHKRAEIANKNNADLFISIHVNANKNTEAFGTDSWIMGLHKSKANLEVAKLENKVIMVEEDFSTKYQGMSADSTEAIIIHTMMQSANLEQSATFASMIQTQFRDRVGRKDRGVHSAPFMVLWKTTMPSVLIETGFISNPEEEKFLSTDNGQTLMASAIYRAFKEYKTNIETKSNFGIAQSSQTSSNSNKQTQSKTQTTATPNNTPAKTQNTQIVATTSNTPTNTKNTTETQKKSDIQYAVQIASSRTHIETKPQNFKGLQNIYVIQEDGWHKYYSGSFNTYKEVTIAHQDIKQKYPEAFIVARKNGTKISIQEAKSITQ